MPWKTALIIVIACIAVPVSSQSLPEGEGRDIVASTCNQCHELSFVTDTRRTRGQWKYIVDMMIGMGAPLPEDQIGVVVDYLASHYGRSAGPAGD